MIERVVGWRWIGWGGLAVAGPWLLKGAEVGSYHPCDKAHL